MCHRKCPGLCETEWSLSYFLPKGVVTPWTAGSFFPYGHTNSLSEALSTAQLLSVCVSVCVIICWLADFIVFCFFIQNTSCILKHLHHFNSVHMGAVSSLLPFKRKLTVKTAGVGILIQMAAWCHTWTLYWAIYTYIMHICCVQINCWQSTHHSQRCRYARTYVSMVTTTLATCVGYYVGFCIESTCDNKTASTRVLQHLYHLTRLSVFLVFGVCGKETPQNCPHQKNDSC